MMENKYKQKKPLRPGLFHNVVLYYIHGSFVVLSSVIIAKNLFE